MWQCRYTEKLGMGSGAGDGTEPRLHDGSENVPAARELVVSHWLSGWPGSATQCMEGWGWQVVKIPERAGRRKQAIDDTTALNIPTPVIVEAALGPIPKRARPWPRRPHEASPPSMVSQHGAARDGMKNLLPGRQMLPRPRNKNRKCLDPWQMQMHKRCGGMESPTRDEPTPYEYCVLCTSDPALWEGGQAKQVFIASASIYPSCHPIPSIHLCDVAVAELPVRRGRGFH